MSISKMPDGKIKNNCFQNCLWDDIINNVHNYDEKRLSLLFDDTIWETNGNSQMRKICHFTCIVCGYDSGEFKYWREHILSVSHATMCHNKKENVFSYACAACKILFYGPNKNIIRHRRKKHSDISDLPCIYVLMEEVLRNCNTNSNDLFFCAHCKTFTEEPLHNFDAKKYTNKVLHYCKYCCVTFLCSTEVLDCHFLSAEHVTLKCISLIMEANKLNNLDKSTTNMLNKIILLKSIIPNYILNRFQSTPQSMAKCKSCKNLFDWKADKIVKHVYLCKNIGQVASSTNKTTIKTYDCRVCDYITDSLSNHTEHVISSFHVTNSRFFGQYFSYFCTNCDLYMYGSIRSIKKHWILHNDNKEITEIPLLSKFLTNNFRNKVKKGVKHSDCKFIDYISDKRSNKKNIGPFPIKCHICKINFFTSVNEYNLHEISSEHIILKYFISNNLSSAMITEANESLQLKSSFNNNYTEKKKASSKSILINRLPNQNSGSNTQKSQEYKGCIEKKVVSNITSLMSLETHKSKGHTDSENSLTNFGHSVHGNCCDDIFNKTCKSSPVIKITPPEFDQSAIVFDDISISSDDEDSINKSCDELEGIVAHQESFVDTSKTIQTPINDTNCMLNKNFNSMEVLQESINDKAYGQYVTQRLKTIHDESVKSEIKLQIDYLFYSKMFLTTKETVKM